MRGFLAEEYAAVIARFKAALIKALPDVPAEEILWRFHFMLGAMSYAMSGTDAFDTRQGPALGTQLFITAHDPVVPPTTGVPEPISAGLVILSLGAAGIAMLRCADRCV